ncbi:hypothetical protein D7S39_12800 [Staphylococcus aureus]|nr:hypothetical protein D7S39_12800 [Staphylococcus aureus]
MASSRQVLRYLPIFYVIITCIYSRSELYSPAEAIYLTVGPAGDFFLAITRYIYLDNIELL